MGRQHKIRPAVDPEIEPQQGMTKDGQPLSYNRAPAPDLAPWIARVYVKKVQAPTDYTLSCGLFNDTACVRVQLAGEWTAQTADGPKSFGKSALFFGPQSHRMPVTVTGSFTSIGMAIRPGACSALKGPRVGDFVDRLVPSGFLATSSEGLLGLFDPAASPEEWLESLEELLRRQVVRHGGTLPDPISLQFEAISFRDPGISVSAAAAECQVERRKLERVVSRDFGMPPKQVLRRARALDMASQLRGVVDKNEADEIALRYYDESHLIHEFTALFGMSPRQFVNRPQPILTLALEARQARRLETLRRLAPGASRPWQ